MREATARLTAIDRAETRLAEGRYDRCERCGGGIPLDRLRAAPTTAMCIDCANAARR